MGDFNDCYPPKPDCDRPHKPDFCKSEFCQPMCGRPCCYEPKCDNDGLGGLGIIIILIVLYFLFCNDNNKGGLLGGLF